MIINFSVSARRARDVLVPRFTQNTYNQCIAHARIVEGKWGQHTVRNSKVKR